MNERGLKRRDFLRLGALAGLTVAAAQAFPKFSWAEVRQVSLDETLALSPEEMGRNSKLVMDSWDYLRKTAETIADPSMKKVVLGILDNPAPTFMTPLMDAANKSAVYQKLASNGWVKDLPEDQFLPATADPTRSPHPFIAAPGSGYTSHHAYPGGVVTHTALNLMVSLALYDGYVKTYGFEMNRDLVIGTQALHDLHKPWVFQWGPEKESRTEQKIAGTGEHHVYGLSEGVFRGLPAEFVVAQACAHNHPGSENDEKQVVGWIKAAAALAGVDPVEKDLLAKNGNTLPLPRRMEGFVCHLGDHDWVLSVPAAQWLIPEMKKLAVKKYGLTEPDLKTARFNQFRNYCFSQATIMTLYHTFSTQGEAGLEKAVAGIVRPV